MIRFPHQRTAVVKFFLHTLWLAVCTGLCNLNMKLNPGDVMFETGQKNGRYKGIYHVEMITGYIFYGFDGNGKAELGIQWATGDEKYYPMGQMVGRP